MGTRRARGDETRYARATPQKVALTETYTVEQEISRNPTIRWVGDGAGRIEVSVPYDGSRYFTRQAVADARRGLGPQPAAADRRAVIGHLLLADHARTSGMPDAMRLRNEAGVIPLIVPTSTLDGSLDLTGDRSGCEISYDYQPHIPVLYPIDLSVELYDLDSLTDDLDSMAGGFETVNTLLAESGDNPSMVIEKLRQNAGFARELLLSFVVRVTIPVKHGYRSPEPIVRDMSVKWPTITSLRSTSLQRENLGPDADTRPIVGVPVRYNPVKGRLEWKDVPTLELRPDQFGGDPGTRIFSSAQAVLRVGHPGELFNESKLDVHAEVEIPRYLLSGTEAALFDATGRQARLPDLTTKLQIHTSVYPADIFAGRAFSPHQQFVFDDIVPDEMRVTDIITVLRNARFETDEPQTPQTQDPLAPVWLIQARRSQGPYQLDLLVAVDGKRIRLDREQIMDASVRVRAGRDSGQLKVSVLGTLRRDHKELTRVMNAVQQELRERFRFHQTSRR